MTGDSDRFACWAAEEFLAAGRAELAEQRTQHRSHALRFADILRLLRERTSVGVPGEDSSVAGLIATAIDWSQNGDAEKV